MALPLAVTQSLFNAEELSGGLEYDAVNGLFGEMHFVQPDAAVVTGFGLLQRNVEPVLLLDGIATTFVVTGLVRLVVERTVGVMNPFAKQGAAGRAANYGVWVVMGKLAAEGSSTRSQPNISGGTGDGSAAGEQRTDGGEQEESNEQ
jgi:hypothetical protein